MTQFASPALDAGVLPAYGSPIGTAVEQAATTPCLIGCTVDHATEAPRPQECRVTWRYGTVFAGPHHVVVESLSSTEGSRRFAEVSLTAGYRGECRYLNPVAAEDLAVLVERAAADLDHGAVGDAGAVTCWTDHEGPVSLRVRTTRHAEVMLFIEGQQRRRWLFDLREAHRLVALLTEATDLSVRVAAGVA